MRMWHRCIEESLGPKPAECEMGNLEVGGSMLAHVQGLRVSQGRPLGP